MTESDCLELWYSALHSPKGLLVQTTDVERLRARLYSARKNADDERLEALMLIVSPTAPQSELWISFRTVEVEDGQG